MENDNKLQDIAECLAAMDTMRQLICGMYGALQEKQVIHSNAVKEFADAEKKLHELVVALPNDVVTLDSIRQAASIVKNTAAKVPEVIKSEMDKVGKGVSDKFISATGSHLLEIKNAAASAMEAASAFNRAAALTQWKTTGLAMFTSTSFL